MADDTNITIEAQDTGFTRYGSTGQVITYTAYSYPTLNPFTPTQYRVTKPAFTPTIRVGTLTPASAITARTGPTDLSSLVSTRIGPADLSTLLSEPVGLDELATIYGLGPLDTTFEDSTNALYTRSYAVARAAAQSGPVNVRGGTARTGFELAELDTQFSINRYKEVWQNQVAWAGVVLSAIERANTAIFEYNKEQVAAIKESTDMIATYDGLMINAVKDSNVLSLERDKTLITATGEYNRVIEGLDRETLSDNEQTIMAEHADATSAYGYYKQLSDNNLTIIQQFTAGRHYGQVGMSTVESLSGKGFQQGGTSHGIGSSSWR